MPVPSDKVKLILGSLIKFGIKNPLVQAGILAVISKETGFEQRNESSYSGTSNFRLRQIFGSRLAGLTEDQLSTLKKNDVLFFDKIYGNRYGNTSPGDGWKFRGRGFNQLTFKDLYKKFGDKIGVDLVKNPERANELKIASDILGAYFADSFRSAEVSGKLKDKFGLSKVSDVKDLDQAVKIAVQSNAGWGIPLQNFVVQEGIKKALEAVQGFMDFVSVNPIVPVPFPDIITDPEKKKTVKKYVPWILGSLALLGIGYGTYQYYKK